MTQQTKSTKSNGTSVSRGSEMGREVQAYGQVVDRPIALDAEARKKSCEALNQLIADSQILYALYKKHHWLMRGPTFYQLHLLLDKQAEEQEVLIDQMAERVQKLGGLAVGDPRHAAELTTIPRPPNGAENVPAMLTRLLQAHQIVLEKVRESIEATEKNEDSGTNDLLVSEVLRTNETHVWYLAEHLVETPLAVPGAE